MYIVTPYRKQKALIMKIICSTWFYKQIGMEQNIRDQRGFKKNVAVMTMDAAIGQEADVVICSMVRREPNTFICDPRRLNVAYSRSKQHFVCIGNAYNLATMVNNGQAVTHLNIYMWYFLQYANHIYTYEDALDITNAQSTIVNNM